MDDYREIQKMAEVYLDEMLKADQDGNYQAFIKRFEQVDVDHFSEETFLADVELMREELGEYRNRHYLGMLSMKSDKGIEQTLRFVWRGIYDKNEALIVLGIHNKDGIWFVNENHIS